jgi:hypothetical protein
MYFPRRKKRKIFSKSITLQVFIVNSRTLKGYYNYCNFVFLLLAAFKNLFWCAVCYVIVAKCSLFFLF